MVLTKRLMNLLLGGLFLAFAMAFLFGAYPRPSSAFLIGVVEKVEVNLFEVSSFLMTGYSVTAFLCGTLGFAWVLAFSYLFPFKVREGVMKDSQSRSFTSWLSGVNEWPYLGFLPFLRKCTHESRNIHVE